jgi:hypothetical protein
MSTVWNEEYSDADEQQNMDLMNDEITEKNIDEEKKAKCDCSKECSKGSCSCFKSGSGCNSSCGCGSSCQNMFNHLQYFFGENSKCSGNLCFANWLVKKGKNGDGLKTIDRYALFRRIKRCPK